MILHDITLKYTAAGKKQVAKHANQGAEQMKHNTERIKHLTKWTKHIAQHMKQVPKGPMYVAEQAKQNPALFNQLAGRFNN